MKLPLALAALLALTGISSAQQKTSRITEMNAKLLAKQSESTASYQADPRVVQATDEAAGDETERTTLSSRLSFLSDGKHCVAIPRGAVIFMPKNRRISELDQITGNLIEWEEFLNLNRGALRLEQVDYQQLQGKKQFSPETIELITQSDLPTLTVHAQRVVALPATQATTSATTEP